MIKITPGSYYDNLILINMEYYDYLLLLLNQFL